MPYSHSATVAFTRVEPGSAAKELEERLRAHFAPRPVREISLRRIISGLLEMFTIPDVSGRMQDEELDRTLMRELGAAPLFDRAEERRHRAEDAAMRAAARERDALHASEERLAARIDSCFREM